MEKLPQKTPEKSQDTEGRGAESSLTSPAFLNRSTAKGAHVNLFALIWPKGSCP